MMRRRLQCGAASVSYGGRGLPDAALAVAAGEEGRERRVCNSPWSAATSPSRDCSCRCSSSTRCSSAFFDSTSAAISLLICPMCAALREARLQSSSTVCSRILILCVRCTPLPAWLQGSALLEVSQQLSPLPSPLLHESLPWLPKEGTADRRRRLLSGVVGLLCGSASAAAGAWGLATGGSWGATPAPSRDSIEGGLLGAAPSSVAPPRTRETKASVPSFCVCSPSPGV
mmetsp:Transcript_18304/g.55081  ORF Transcript_18304/g.55081 Transcript_18304/m.55081 type:complete len:229 (+) Transcript_18304:1943-2629(+)